MTSRNKIQSIVWNCDDSNDPPKFNISTNKFMQETQIVWNYWFPTNKCMQQSLWIIWNEQFQRKSLRNKNVQSTIWNEQFQWRS